MLDSYREEAHQRALLGAHPLTWRENRRPQCMAARPCLVLGVSLDHMCQELLDSLEVPAEQTVDLLDRDMVLGVIEPAVIIGRNRDRAVAELGLAREERLRHVGHTHEIRA